MAFGQLFQQILNQRGGQQAPVSAAQQAQLRTQQQLASQQGVPGQAPGHELPGQPTLGGFSGSGYLGDPQAGGTPGLSGGQIPVPTGIGEYQQAQQSMRDQFAQNLAAQQTKALGGVQDIFAGRGTTGSGEEATALGETAGAFGRQAGMFEAGLNLDLANMLTGQGQFERQMAPGEQEQSQFTDLAKQLGYGSALELQLALTDPDTYNLLIAGRDKTGQGGTGSPQAPTQQDVGRQNVFKSMNPAFRHMYGFDQYMA